MKKGRLLFWIALAGLAAFVGYWQWAFRHPVKVARVKIGAVAGPRTYHSFTLPDGVFYHFYLANASGLGATGAPTGAFRIDACRSRYEGRISPQTLLRVPEFGEHSYILSYNAPGGDSSPQFNFGRENCPERSCGIGIDFERPPPAGISLWMAVVSNRRSPLPPFPARGREETAVSQVCGGFAAKAFFGELGAVSNGVFNVARLTAADKARIAEMLEDPLVASARILVRQGDVALERRARDVLIASATAFKLPYGYYTRDGGTTGHPVGFANGTGESLSPEAYAEVDLSGFADLRGLVGTP